MDYFKRRERSQGHTAIYKLHKYFARRPHNQFRALVEHYVPADGIVLDCFAGGGVTLVEGLTLDRRVIAVDINPIAALVQRGQVLEVPATLLNSIIERVAQPVADRFGEWFEAACPSCDHPAAVRWFEHAYLVPCPACGISTPLSNENLQRGDGGRRRPGGYLCEGCGFAFRSVDQKRQGSLLLSLRIRCSSCGAQTTRNASTEDQQVYDEIAASERDIARADELEIPHIAIPDDWDRQAEDALARKGFATFADLFTPRNRIVMASLFKSLDSQTLEGDEYLGTLLALSALLRYTNNMTFSTSSWMDGRPVSWAKHAYWTPNQFVEVNPFEYLRHRQLAVRKAEQDRRTRFSNKAHSAEVADVLMGLADYSILCADARSIDLPDESVDAVVTDPPFGSNVQYGELTHLWSVWLGARNPYKSVLFDLSAEVLVRRRSRAGGKNAESYREGLSGVFQECWRVLKQGGPLVFTFNNRAPEVWYAAMRAAFDSGFSLNDEGVHYIDEIRAYRDTAHLRYDSELQGDVVYTFVKGGETQPVQHVDPTDWIRGFAERLPAEAESGGGAELAVALHLDVIRHAARSIDGGESQGETMAWLELLRVTAKAEGTLRQRCMQLVEAL